MPASPGALRGLGILAGGLGDAYKDQLQREHDEKIKHTDLISNLVANGIKSDTIDPNEGMAFLTQQLKGKGKGKSGGAGQDLLSTITQATGLAGTAHAGQQGQSQPTDPKQPPAAAPGSGSTVAQPTPASAADQTSASAPGQAVPPTGTNPATGLPHFFTPEERDQREVARRTLDARAGIQAKVTEAAALREQFPDMTVEDSLERVGLKKPVPKATTSHPAGKPVPSDSIADGAMLVDGTPLTPEKGKFYQPVLFVSPDGSEVRYTPAAGPTKPKLPARLQEKVDEIHARSGIDPNEATDEQNIAALKKAGQELEADHQLDNASKRALLANRIQAGATATGLPGLTGPAGQELPVVSLTAAGQPDPVAQDEFLKPFSAGLRTMIKGLTDYSINPADFSNRTASAKGGGVTRAQAIAWAKQYDPTYSDTQYAQRNKVETDWKSGKTKDAMVATNTVVAHLKEMADAAKKLEPYTLSTLPILNEGKLRAQRQTNPTVRTALRDFQTARDAVALELRKVYSGSAGGSLQEIKDWQDNSSPYAAPDDKKTFLQTATNLMLGRVNANVDSYKASMGRAPIAGLALTPRSLGVLKDLGITADRLDPALAGVDPLGLGK